MKVLILQNLAYAKFRENKTLAKISKFTVIANELAACSTFHIQVSLVNHISVVVEDSFEACFENVNNNVLRLFMKPNLKLPG